MKKIVATLACGAILATCASADFTRVEMGVGAWDQKPSGTGSYTDTTTSATGSYVSHEKKNTSTYAWLLIKHPIPIVPNLRVEYANIKDTGDVEGSFKDFVVPVGQLTTSSLELTQFDVIPYYNLLDNTFWTTVDVGIDLKVQESKLDVAPIAGGVFAGYHDTKTVVIPMVYARVRVQLPLNLGAEADVKYVTYSGSTVYDARAKVDYTLDFIPVVQPALEVGYRVQKFDLSTDDDKTKLNMEFKGFYAGLMLRF